MKSCEGFYSGKLYTLAIANNYDMTWNWYFHIHVHIFDIGTRFVDPPFFYKFFNSSLLWDVFIINSVEKLQTLPKTQSKIDIRPFLKTEEKIEGFCVFRNTLISISDWVFDITEILLKVALNTITLTPPSMWTDLLKIIYILYISSNIIGTRFVEQYFSYIVAVSFIGGGNQNTRRIPPTCRKSLTNLIT
jgi:hypothetical protein